MKLTAVLLNSAVLALVGIPVETLPAIAETAVIAESKISHLKDYNRPATTLKEWRAQVEAAIVRVTNVKVDRTINSELVQQRH